ncbi:MAG TPA: L,D-transpeptidase [Abditibacteriaceae bacterium]|jgi:hypothetical protein
MTLRSTVESRLIVAFGALLSCSLWCTTARAEGELPAASPEEVAAVISSLPSAPGIKKASAPQASAITPAVSATPAASGFKPLPQSIEPKLVPSAAQKNIPAVAVKDETLREAVQRLNLTLPLPDARVIVWKSQRRLEIWSGKTLVKSYRVALGATPTGHKIRQGDSRTPEGEFFICTRNDQTSAFHIFLGLSYPALPDAKRGLAKKAITEREFMAIRSRLASRGTPLWETRLGGWVGIHGGTGQPFARKQTAKRGSPDWTAGCIALTNKEIEDIHAATKLGTPVSVRP